MQAARPEDQGQCFHVSGCVITVRSWAGEFAGRSTRLFWWACGRLKAKPHALVRPRHFCAARAGVIGMAVRTLDMSTNRGTPRRPNMKKACAVQTSLHMAELPDLALRRGKSKGVSPSSLHAQTWLCMIRWPAHVVT